MKILQVLQKPQRRGAEIFNHQLCSFFAQLGHDVHTVYLYPHPGAFSLPIGSADVVLGGDEAHPFERIPGIHPGLLNALRRRILSFVPEIVQVNGARTVKYGAVAKWLSASEPKWKLVYRNIDIPSFWNKRRASLAVYRRLMSQVDGAIGICNYSMNDASRLYDLHVPCMTVHNRIDTASLVVADDRSSIRARYGVGQKDLVLLFAGSLVPQKRPDRFLQVVARMIDRHPDISAWIVGDGRLRSRVEAQAGQLGIADRCTFFGHQDKVADFMVAADMLILSSDTEGLPGVALEAGYLGIPVVATNVGGVSEGILHERTGLVVPEPFEDGLLEAATSLAEDEPRRRYLGETARSWVSSNFTMEGVAETYVAFYERLLRN